MASVFGAFGSSRRGNKDAAGAAVAAVDRRPRIDGIGVDRLPEVIAEMRRGSRRRVTTVGEDVLARPCREVHHLASPSLRRLIDDMYATMACCNGVGLAANQIGVELRIFVYDCEDAYGVRHVGHVINPVLDVAADRAGKESDEEGCLSVPGPVAQVSRATTAVVRGVDMFGKPVLIEGTGTLARCLQHECDHLEGKLYIDRLSGRERKKVMKALEEQRAATYERWDARSAELGKPAGAELDPAPPVVDDGPAPVAALVAAPVAPVATPPKTPVVASSTDGPGAPALLEHDPAPDVETQPSPEVETVPPESSYDDKRPAELPEEDEAPRA